MKKFTLLESLMDASHDGIFIAEVKTGNIVFANKAACDLLGYTDTEIIGIHQTKLHPSEDCDFISHKFKEFVSTSDYKEIDARVIHKEGYLIPVKITSANLFVDDSIMYAAAYFRDMRLHKNLQEIAYLQSHVIRRPLANILGLCSLIKEGIFKDCEIDGAVDNILQQAEELDVVIKEIFEKTNNK